MTDSSHPSCRIICDLLLTHGVRDAVVSPGSRNTPLIIALSARGEITKHTVIDERAAAFYALGRALVTQRPVALCCTSGTAMLDYSPAIAEAYYQGVPLIVLTADRPAQWIDQDDSQTLRQPGALDNFVKQSYNIPVIHSTEEKEKCWLANRLINDALLKALDGRQGPVHINVQLDGALGATTDITDDPHICGRKIEMIAAEAYLSPQTLDALAKQLLDSNTLVVAGALPPSHKLNHAINLMQTLPNVYIMHETISNLRLKGVHNAIDSILSAINEEQRNELRPELTITLGGALVSRMIKEYLRKGSTESRMEHWSIGRQHTTVDCLQSLTKRIEIDPEWFMRQIIGRVHRLLKKGYRPTSDSSYARKWESVKTEGLNRLQRHIDTAPWSDLTAFDTIFRNIPDDANLFLSNGTTIRYAQLLMKKIPNSCRCNRGVSGIDGTTATAIGGASVYGGTTVLVTGDMSLHYDSGALSLDNGSGKMVIIVVNNGGGGIFRFISATRNIPERETYLSPQTNAAIEKLAEAYGWEWKEAVDKESLSKVLGEAFASESNRILVEVKTGDGKPDILRDLLIPDKEPRQTY